MGTLLEYSSSYNSILSYIYKYNYYTDGFISGSRLINEKIFNNSNYQNYDNLGNVFEVFIDGEISSSFKYDYDIHGNIIKITKTNYPPESYRRPPYISETILFEYMY